MRGKASRRFLAVALFGAMTFLCAFPTEAASRICRQLESELARTGVARGQPRLLAKYDDAISRQRAEIEKARSQAHRAGCFLPIFGKDGARCSMLRASVKRMSVNLDKLEAKRERLAGGNSTAHRRAILARLEANGCGRMPKLNRPDVSPREERHEATALREMLHARDQQPEKTEFTMNEDSGRARHILDPQNGNLIRIAPPKKLAGKFRTMCVRSCDGYFFPMSNTATLRDFERDQKNCESSCPGTEMQVFYGRGPDADIAEMTSASTGLSYHELPTAWLYKRTDISGPQCGCRMARDFSLIGGTADPQKSTDGGQSVSSSILSFANPGDAPAADLRTTRADDALEKEATEVPIDEAKRNVRVVGPRFLPDPEEAIDLRAPARTQAR